jgi:magnesium chelatase family protein
MADVRGQETARRALEITAAGGHNLLMNGPPGSGKSMLAARLPGIMPPLSAREALDVSMIHSVAGLLADGKLLHERPFRDPHHSASPAALVGGGLRVRPGEISLAHNGILFLDELPEFQRSVLEALRQPMENGEVVVARANHHVRYPANFQFIAAMNPCRCAEPDGLCRRGPRCASDYQAKISGPIYDRIDLHVTVPAVKPRDLAQEKPGEPSAMVRDRVLAARALQTERFNRLGLHQLTTNSELSGEALTQAAALSTEAQEMLYQAAERMGLSARGYHRVIRVARTIADLAADEAITRAHVAEALSYRRMISTIVT